MNVNKIIKLLLLKINRKGIDCTLITEQRYSKNFESIYSKYKLTFWNVMPDIDKKTGKQKIDKDTGEPKTKNIANTIEFKNSIELLK